MHANLWCDQAKWVGTRWYWFLYKAIDSVQFPLYFIVLSITKMAVSLEPYAKFVWIFQSELLKLWNWGIQFKWKLSFYFFEFRLILLDRITFVEITDVIHIHWHHYTETSLNCVQSECVTWQVNGEWTEPGGNSIPRFVVILCCLGVFCNKKMCPL